MHGFIAGFRDQRLGDEAPDQRLPEAGQCRWLIEEVEGHRLAANECQHSRLSRLRLQVAEPILDLWPALLLDVRVGEGLRVHAEISKAAGDLIPHHPLIRRKRSECSSGKRDRMPLHRANLG